MRDQKDMNDRTCLSCRQKHGTENMIRFVAAPDGSVVADLKRTLPGRGVWVCAKRESVDKAADKNLFARGLKMNVSVSRSLGSDVDALIEKAALAGLGFARKAGQCVTGAVKVDGAIRSGKAIALLHAIDAADDGIAKLARAVGVSKRNGREVRVLKLFDSDKMRLALGGENVIHAALTNGGAASSFLKRAEMLIGYRGGSPKTGESDRQGAESFPKDVEQVLVNPVQAMRRAQVARIKRCL